MSVVVQGMEMPTSCASCEWSKLSKMDLGMSCFCTLAKKIGSLEIAKNNRMDFCPLVPVPPHGRLIDGDELTKMCHEMQGIEWNNNAAPYSWAYAYESFENDIDEAPTVIEAEEGDE